MIRTDGQTNILCSKYLLNLVENSRFSNSPCAAVENLLKQLIIYLVVFLQNRSKFQRKETQTVSVNALNNFSMARSNGQTFHRFL